MSSKHTAKREGRAASARRAAGARLSVPWFIVAALCGASPASAEPPPAAEPATPPPSEPPPPPPASTVANTSTAAADTAAAAATPGTTIDPALRRDPSQYRGRTNPTTAAEALAWIPRVVFFPVYLVTEYGIRVPIYAAAEWVERNHVVPIVQKVLNPHPDFSWSPTLSLDLGAITFVGVQGKWENAGVPGHEVRAAVAFGGLNAWRARLQDRWQLTRGVYAGARGQFETRWDRPFYGLGTYSADFRTNFSITRGDAFAFAGFERGNHFRLQPSVGYRQEQTAAGGAPSTDDHFSIEEVPGFGSTLHLGMASLDLKLDSRRELEQIGGIRFLGNVTYARDLLDVDRSFLTAEADLEIAAEVSVPDRVLAARLYAADTMPLGDWPVPFTHLAMLGGKNHQGFLWARFRDESAVMAELRYRYPINYYMDAQWTASAGNVFARHFEDFDLGALTGSIGAGLRTRRIGPAPLELTFAVGTSRFDERFAIENFRVYFSTTEGL